jgi:hypothetical protein
MTEPGSTVHVPDRTAFMHHAYNALFSEQAYAFPLELRARVVAEISQDLCRLVRTMPKAAQDEFIRDIREQIKDS